MSENKPESGRRANRLVPTEVFTAAKRGFIRTSSQALATTIPTGGITGAALSSGDVRVIAISISAAVLSSLAAGAVSFLNILSAGVPEDYVATSGVDITL